MTDRPVLVLTQVDDVTADLVIKELNRRSVPVMRFDPGRDFPSSVTFAAELGVHGAWIGGVRTETRRSELADVRSVYWRRPSPYTSTLTGQTAEFAKAQARFGFGGVLQALDTLHVNHPRRTHAAEYKPVQLAVAGRLGFSVPPTLITNDLDQARAFAAEHRPVIYKVLRQTDYEEDGHARTVWVDQVNPAELDDSISGTAHLFQKMIPKLADIRVTVVGRRVFCVRIDAPAGLLDWRADYSQLKYSVVDPPTGIVNRLHAYLDDFGLASGCFDFGLERDGSWTFIECNPNGQWAWMEGPTGLPMTVAFADLLENDRA